MPQHVFYRDARKGVADLAAMLGDLRQGDVDEWRAASGSTPAEHVASGTWEIGPKDRARVACDAEGVPMLLYGVVEARPGLGAVWLIACNRALRHVIEFHRSWDSEIAFLAAGYQVLVAMSWYGNPDHHEWLKWLGFRTAGPLLPWGPFGDSFQPFLMEVPDVLRRRGDA